VSPAPKTRVVSEAIAAAIPDTNTTVSQWAARYRYLSELASMPGPWNNEVTPYLVEPMDCVGLPGIFEVIFVASSQIGKTEFCLNAIGYLMHKRPSTILYVAETDKKAEAWSKEKLAPMIRATPALRSLVRDARSRDADNTLAGKSFPGGHLAIGYATSAETLSSRSRRTLFLDERDAYKPTKEGDPAALAEKRTITFRKERKVVKVSSPRDRLEPEPGSPPDAKRFSPIEWEYEQTDKRKYYVPCPHCAEYQVLTWKNAQGAYNIQWDEGDIENAYYMCVNGCVIEHEHKAGMLARGEWRAEKPFEGRAGFWIWEAYSPFVTWGEIAANFLRVKKDAEQLKVFVNTTLAEGWVEFEGGVEVDDLEKRREPYTDLDFLPDGVLVITAGADVQRNRLEYEIVGHGLDGESWSLDYGVIPGDPTQRGVWAELKAALLRNFAYEMALAEAEDDETGGSAVLGMRVMVACVDSGGFNPQEVYRFCYENAGRRFYATKGTNTPGKPIISSFSWQGRPPVRLYTVGTEAAKDTFDHRLAVTKPGPGFCHFPTEFQRDGRTYYGEDYFKQLRSERPVVKHTRQGTVRVWEKIKPGARNEALDCRVLAMAALAILNPDLEKMSARRLSGIAPPKAGEGQQRKKGIIRRGAGRRFVPGFSGGGPLGGRF
jgi:phage terminase large subunit GpA-like protein